MRKRINQLKTQVTVSVDSFFFNVILFFLSLAINHQLDFDAHVWTSNDLIKRNLMIDTKTFAKKFVKDKFVKRYRIFILFMSKKINFKLIDEFTKHALIKMTIIKIRLKNHVKKMFCLITSLNKFDVIFDMFWIEKHDVNIQDHDRSFIFQFEKCMQQCISNKQLFKIFNRTSSNDRSRFKSLKKLSSHRKKTNVNCAVVSIEVFMIMTTKKDHEIVVLWFQHFEQLNKFEEIDKYLTYSNLIVNFSTISANDYEKFFVKHNKISLTIKKLKKKISEKFHKYVDVWNSKLINELFFHRKWNHAINFVSDVKSSIKKAYELFKEQAAMIKQYINDMLNKKYIKFSTSKYATSILIIKKSNEKLRICVNYKALNDLIIKNRNAFSLIRDTLIKLFFVKYFNKFDIITTFNEIRMRQENEKKIAFLTRYDFFEYVVMSFEFCNALDIFQSFINATLHEYLDDFCINYMNDIFIYSKTRQKHIIHVFKMLKKLQKTNLYLNINKCEFFVTQVKYLKFIITIEKIKMNSVKIKVIINWSRSRNLKNVQVFLEFANFYRKFILSYSQIANSLIKLTKINEKEFKYSWKLNESKQEVFETFKKIFTTTFVLQHFDSNKETWLKTNASNYIVTEVLSQVDDDDILRFVVFMFKRMFFVECNYEIYDKKFFAIIRVFEKWRFECADTSIECFIKILTNHQNLKYFMSSKNFNKRQARWTKFLFEFNFLITFRSDKQNIKTNNLTRRIEDLFVNEDDERKIHNRKRLLKNEHLNRKIRKVVELISMLLNESEKNVAWLIALIYDLNEKEFVDEKFIEKSSTERIQNENEKQKVNEELLVDEFDVQFEIMKLIRAIYFDDIIFQRLMKIKKFERRKISINITKAKIKLKLKRCEIRDDLFWVKKRIYVFQNEKVYAALIKQMHDL